MLTCAVGYSTSIEVIVLVEDSPVKLDHKKLWEELKEQVKIWRESADSVTNGWNEDEIRGHDRAWRYVLEFMMDADNDPNGIDEKE